MKIENESIKQTIALKAREMASQIDSLARELEFYKSQLQFSDQKLDEFKRSKADEWRQMQDDALQRHEQMMQQVRQEVVNESQVDQRHPEMSYAQHNDTMNKTFND